VRLTTASHPLQLMLGVFASCVCRVRVRERGLVAAGAAVGAGAVEETAALMRSAGSRVVGGVAGASGRAARARSKAEHVCYRSVRRLD